jgi:hypothetical protein
MFEIYQNVNQVEVVFVGKCFVQSFDAYEKNSSKDVIHIANGVNINIYV